MGTVPKSVAVTSTIVLAAMSVVFAPVAMSEPVRCMDCWNLEGFGGPAGVEDAHIFSYWHIGRYGGHMDCHAFNACHSTFDQPGFCGLWHWGCGASSQALAEAREMVATGDVGGLIRLSSEEAPLVSITLSGYAVIRDCIGDGLVAAIRLPNAFNLTGIPTVNRPGLSGESAS